jgi:demethylmenaquinone methyltransferase/2-methoxy-6-polyprenyl-1,4-benzoquinol methylase
VCLEIYQPTSLFGRTIGLWFDRVVPLIGRLIGQGDAYAYLARSVKGYPPPARIAEIMRDAGLEQVDWEPLAGGIIALHSGVVPAPSEGAAA